MSINHSEHLDYIDYARGIGIMLVVLGHLLGEGGFIVKGGGVIRDVIYSFHMPLFFCISGILLAHSLQGGWPTWDWAKRRVRSAAVHLLVPYFCWSLVYCALAIVQTHGRIDLYEWVVCTLSFRGRAPLWFLAALFESELVLVLLIVGMRIRHSKLVTMLMVALCLLAHFIWGRYYRFFDNGLLISYVSVNVWRSTLCLLFTAFGYRLHDLLKRGFKSRTLCIFLICGGMAAVLALTAYCGAASNLHTYSVNNCVAYISSGMLGSVSVLILCHLINLANIIKRFFAGIGTRTMGIMAIHYVPFPTMLIAKETCSKLSLSGWPALLSALIITVVISVIGTEMLSKRMLV